MSLMSPSLKTFGHAVPARSDQPFRGILLLMGSTIFLASSDAMAKYLAKTLPPVEVAWLRFAMFALIMLPAILMNPGVLRSARPGLQALRGLSMFASSLLFITGLRYLPIAEAASTAFIAPVFVTALSVALLSEKVGKRRWAATFVGLCGVLVVMRPGTAAFHPAAILPLLSAVAWACTLIATRLISGADRVVTTMSYAALVGFLALSAIVPLYWVTPTWDQVMIGGAIGVAATMGHWIVVVAFRYADASVLAPFSYSQLLWVALLGYAVFGEVPDVWTFAGAGIIIASGIYTAHRERQRRVAEALSELCPSV